MFRFLIVVVIPVCVGILFLYLHFQSSLTPTKGNLSAPGLIQPVEIIHDSYGAPSIIAKTDHDAYFALGFKHASDRMWQLEIQRRLSQGRLSELFGVETLAQDITMRNIGLYDAAKQSLPYLKKDTIDALAAYAEGINAWIAQSNNLPIEFQLFDVHPEPWTVVDSLGWQKVFSMMLSGNMTDELLRNRLQSRFNPQQMQYFYPYDPIASLATTHAVTNELSPYNLVFAKSNSLLNFGIGHLFAGSNAWVVSGKYTQSGSPIIANDPHLGLQIPSLWYAASLRGEKLNVAGMTLVGLPVVIYGKNSDIAWVGTSLMSDQQDLYVETISPQKPNQYLYGDEWKSFDVHKEQIVVSAAFPAFLREKLNPVEIVVRKTERGPVISDVHDENDAVISLRWSALDAEDLTMDAFVGVQYAKNWIEFRQALSKLKSPGLNYLYADVQGNIGFQAAGMMPVRAEGGGVIPLVSKRKNDWQGYHEFDSLPSVYNPEKGFIVSANEQVVHSPDLVISHEWAMSARHDRITDLLQQSIHAKKLVTVSDMEVIQVDRKDLSALELLPFLLQVVAETQQEKQALEILKEWNGEFQSGSVGATLFAVWSHYLIHEIFDPALRPSWQRPVEANQLSSSLDRLSWAQLAKVVSASEHGWCKSNQSPVCSQEMKNSFKSALKQLNKMSGTEVVSKWKWSEFGSTEFLSPGNGVEWLSKKIKLSLTSPNSVNAGNVIFDETKGFIQTFGSSFRQVIELNSDKDHWYMNSTGQSGNIVSPHYDDMIIPFSGGQLVPIAANKRSEEILNLTPVVEKK